jgi:succinyl-CoA synthetase beta subunit
MIDELRGTSILKDTRGHKPSDLAAASEALLRLSQLLIDFPEIRELDINPLRVFQKNNSCRSLDARIMIRSSSDNQPPVL